MKIQGEIPSPELDPKISETRQAGVQGRQEPAPAPVGGETVELSGRARDLAKLSQEIQSVPEAPAPRLDEIKASVQNGTYSVKGEDLAESILKGLSVDLRL